MKCGPCIGISRLKIATRSSAMSFATFSLIITLLTLPSFAATATPATGPQQPILLSSPVPLPANLPAAERIPTVLGMSALRTMYAIPTTYAETTNHSMAQMRASSCGGDRAAQVRHGQVPTASQTCATQWNLKTTTRQCKTVLMATSPVGQKVIAVRARDCSRLQRQQGKRLLYL